jgi:hypothetical protein
MKLYLPVIALIASAIVSPAQSYKLTDLGAVPGQNVSAGYGLNAFGEAVGNSSSPNGAIPTVFSEQSHQPGHARCRRCVRGHVHQRFGRNRRL